MATKPRVFERTPTLSAVASQKLVKSVLSNPLTEARERDLMKYASLAHQAFLGFAQKAK